MSEDDEWVDEDSFKQRERGVCLPVVLGCCSSPSPYRNASSSSKSMISRVETWSRSKRKSLSFSLSHSLTA